MGSVRARITLIAALATAIAVTLAGIALIVTLSASLRQEVDESLERQVANFSNEIASFSDLDTVAVPGDFETLLAVVDDSGFLYLANDVGADGPTITDQLSLNPLALDVEFADIALPELTQTSGAQDMRAAYYELFPEDLDDNTVLFAVVARSNDPTDRTVGRVRNAVLAGVPLLTAFVAALAWWLTGRSLRPVDLMRREVDEMSSTDLARRVSEPVANDEIGQLAKTMNAMLSRLEAAQKSQDQFVSDAAHELRTPLASIAAQLDVDVAHPDTADTGATAANVRVEISRLQSLIDGLLAAARGQNELQQGRMNLLDLDVIASTATNRVTGPDNIVVDRRGIGIGTVRGDEAALTSVVDNLLANAFRHAASAVAIGVGSDSAGVWLAVDDDGSGVQEEDRERVFDRFVRLDEARTKDAGGSGLGLSLAHEAAVAHGGTLHVEDSILGGARFVLRLPAAT